MHLLEILIVNFIEDRISKNLLKKARRLFYVKDKVLGKLHNELENKIKLYVDENDNIIAPSSTPFIELKKNIDRWTLYIIEKIYDTTLVFMWNTSRRENFNFYFSAVLC